MLGGNAAEAMVTGNTLAIRLLIDNPWQIWGGVMDGFLG